MSGADIRPVVCWRLDTAIRTAVFASFGSGIPALAWFGHSLPIEEDLEALSIATIPNVSAGQLDPLVPLTLCPSAATGWQGHPGVIVRDADGAELLFDWRLAGHEVGDDGFHRWQIDAGGAADEFTLKLAAKLHDTGVLALRINCQRGDIFRIEWLAAAIPVPSHLPRIIDHGGRWTGEFQRQEHRFATGQHVRESREGRTGHAHFPGVMFASDACGENAGDCLAVTLAWSGGHKIIAEEIPDGRRQVQCGFDPATHDSKREVLVAFSDVGLNGLAQQMQHHVRQEIVKPTTRPVHYNCWEAVYFRHDLQELKEIATLAASLGAERFVLDDGWFKGRNNDTTSLGDWFVDPTKFPQGLTPLIEHVASLGLRFGLWFEPEMVNKDSDLFRAHPDWVLGPAFQPSGRNQFVLDLTRPGVTDYLFDCISAILRAHPIDYVKWDHNRILTGAAPQQTIQLYALLDRLNDAFPGVDFESCASGGGRIDYGILARTTRVWLSDSNDALERLRMQHEAARWLPPEVVGSHVGPRLCHTSGRNLPIAFRAWVAAQRHMGFEMDPRELTQSEAAVLATVTDWWKDNRHFLFSARQFLLESTDPEVVAEMHVDEHRDRFIVFKGQLGASGSIASRPLRLAGLDADAIYEISLINPEDAPKLLNRYPASGFTKGEPVRLSGRMLMQGGLLAPNVFPATMLVFNGCRVGS